jgi:hypothetical protein
MHILSQTKMDTQMADLRILLLRGQTEAAAGVDPAMISSGIGSKHGALCQHKSMSTGHVSFEARKQVERNEDGNRLAAAPKGGGDRGLSLTVTSIVNRRVSCGLEGDPAASLDAHTPPDSLLDGSSRRLRQVS